MIDYTQAIYRRLFQGFTFNEKSWKIEPLLSQQNVEGLIQLGKNEFGYTESYALNLITKTVAKISNIFDFTNMISVDSLRLADLRPYSIIRIHYDGPALTLLYLGGCQFCLLKDELHTLLPGDRLQCWTYSLILGGDATFRVSRNGHYYPDEQHVLKINHIECIDQLKPLYLPHFTNSSHNVAAGINAISAWQATDCDCGFAFLPQDLTTESTALFNIDLKRMTFSLNKDFEQSIYPNYLDVVRTICDYKEEADIEKRRRTIREGKVVSIVCNANQYALQIKTKALITL